MRGSFIMDSSDIMMVWLGGSVADSIILHVKWNKLIRKVYQWWQPQWLSSSDGSVALEAAWCHCAANCGRSYTTINYNEYQMGGGK
jgi:hypothetical protein